VQLPDPRESRAGHGYGAAAGYFENTEGAYCLEKSSHLPRVSRGFQNDGVLSHIHHATAENLGGLKDMGAIVHGSPYFDHGKPSFYVGAFAQIGDLHGLHELGYLLCNLVYHHVVSLHDEGEARKPGGVCFSYAQAVHIVSPSGNESCEA